jgi:hypothetical protein
LRKELRHAGRIAAFLLLAVLTAYGLFEFARGDWESALAYWRAHAAVFPVVLALGALDVALEALAAMWVYTRFGVRAFDGWGTLVCLSMRAGLLLPAQLSRLIRADRFVALGRSHAAPCLQAEAATFALDLLSVVAIVAGALAWRLAPAASLPTVLAVTAAGLGIGRLLAGRLQDTRFELPRDFWWRPSSFGVVALEGAAWLAHGLAFWLLVRALPGSTGAAEAVLASALSAVLGASTGAPGGVGVTDGLLGAWLRWMEVPVEQLALVVLGFRFATFWIWIPAGWFALVVLQRAAAAPGVAPATDEPARSLRRRGASRAR